MLSLGEQDGIAAASYAATHEQEIEDTLDYFAHKSLRNPEVFNTSFEEYLTKKANGVFKDFNRKEHKKLKALYEPVPPMNVLEELIWTKL